MSKYGMPYNGCTEAECATYQRADVQVSRNFTSGEFRSRRDSRWQIHPSLIALAQEIRDHFGLPLVITSADRNEGPNHNGLAIDFKIPVSKKKVRNGKIVTSAGTVSAIEHNGDWRIHPTEIGKFLKTLGVGGIGVYLLDNKKHVHADVRSRNRFWVKQ